MEDLAGVSAIRVTVVCDGQLRVETTTKLYVGKNESER